MQIILTTEDTLRLILLGLKIETGITPSEIYIGPVDGEIKTYAAVGEAVPPGVFDDDAEDDTPDVAATAAADQPEPKQRKKRVRRTKEQIAADEAAKQAAETKQPQQASGEAAGESQDAKQPETKGTEAEKVLEAEPETGADKAAAAATTVAETAGAGEAADLFADPEPAGSVAQPETQAEQPEVDLFAEPEDTKEVVTSAGQNPFGGDTEANHPEVAEDSLDLFSDPAPTANAGQPTTQTEDGFVKPAGDDQVLDLFS